MNINPIHTREIKISRPRLPIGEQLTCYYAVRLEDTIHFSVDSRLPKILGSYVLMGWMEIQCGKSVQNKLPNKYVSLGNEFSITHRVPALISEQVEIQSSLVEQTGWILHFTVTARCNDYLIAHAKHTRNIVPEKMLDRMRKRS